MFISQSKHWKLVEALGSDFISAQDGNYEAWDELEQEDQDLIDKADSNNDDWGVENHQIEWDSNAGNQGQIGLVVHTSVNKSEIDEAAEDTSSELYQALQRYGEKWAEKQIEMLENRLNQRMQELENKTYLSEKEAELYILTEELDINIREASDLMDISKNNAYGKRGRIKKKIEKAERTADLQI